MSRSSTPRLPRFCSARHPAVSVPCLGQKLLFWASSALHFTTSRYPDLYCTSNVPPEPPRAASYAESVTL